MPKDKDKGSASSSGVDISELQPSSSLIVGSVFDERYLVVTQLGDGGMGCVYRAIDHQTDGTVALKVLHPSLLSDNPSRQRFIREGKASSQLTHRNIVQVNKFAITPNGLLYMEMEYLNGQSLAEALIKSGPLPLPRFVNIFTQVLSALTYAHEHEIVHRDLKPGNIMLVKSSKVEKVKLVDFGVAKLLSDSAGQQLTGFGEFIGSPSFMSPEQCAGETVDARADIYSLGCVMYEAISGSRAFTGSSSLAIMHKQVHELPLQLSVIRPDGSVPGWLERIIYRALAKDPDNRYQTAEAMKADLLDARFTPGKEGDTVYDDSSRLPWERFREEVYKAQSDSGSFEALPERQVGETTERIKAAASVNTGVTTNPTEFRSFDWAVLKLLKLAVLVTDEELAAARQYQRENGGDLGRILVILGTVENKTLLSAIKAQRLIELEQLTLERATAIVGFCQKNNLYYDEAVGQI